MKFCFLLDLKVLFFVPFLALFPDNVILESIACCGIFSFVSTFTLFMKKDHPPLVPQESHKNSKQKQSHGCFN